MITAKESALVALEDAFSELWGTEDVYDPIIRVELFANGITIEFKDRTELYTPAALTEIAVRDCKESVTPE